MGRLVELSEDALNLSLFGDNSDFMYRYMEEQLDDYEFDSDSYLYRSLRSSMDYITDDFRRREIRDELRRNRVKEKGFEFDYIDSFEGLRKTNRTTQRWVMAHPEVRKLYLNQDLDGYSGSYTNFTEGVGKDDYNYRRATNGMLMIDENGDGRIDYYYEDLMDGDSELRQDLKEEIGHMWDFISAQMKLSNRDFTNADDDEAEMNR